MKAIKELQKEAHETAKEKDRIKSIMKVILFFGLIINMVLVYYGIKHLLDPYF